MSIKKTGVFATFRAVAWSFFGVRSSAGHDDDLANLKPAYVIAAGVILGVLFVFSLLAIVQIVLLA